MERVIPDWRPFDPDSGGGAGLPEAAPTGGPRFVAVLTTAGARQAGWAAKAATALARAWARERGRVLLADLDLMEPRLHDAVDVENGEGMSDAFLYGASIQRIARPVESGFLFAPAGTVVADPAEVLTSERWDTIMDGFAQAGATLVAHLPVDAAGSEELLDRCTDVVLLARSADVDATAVGAWGDRVRAVLGPPGDAGVAAADGAGTTIDVERADGSGDRSGSSTAPGSGPADRRKKADEGTGGRRTAALLLVLLVVVLAVIVAGWYGLIDVPFVTPRDADASAPGDGAAATTAEPAPGTAAPSPAIAGPAPFPEYSVALAAYRNVAEASQRAGGLADRRPDLLFVVAPVEVDGVVYHRLLAGPAEDSTAAAALRSDLGAGLVGETPDRWLTRATPFAFHLGAFASLAEAHARAEELRGVGIVPYVLQVDAPGDAEPFRLYAGAYADHEEAAYTGRVLEAAGLDGAPLTLRVGRIPTPE